MSEAKRAAGRRAAELVEDGMRVGLGTGSTVFFTLERLGERVREDDLSIVGVPTSVDTETKARQFGIPLASLAEVESLDLTIDGADEIDGDYQMIKGGGGALLREKVIASISKREAIVVGPAKVVERLGTTFRLPVEVVPFARPVVERALRALGCEPGVRTSSDGAEYRTDNGNAVLDCHFEQGIADPRAMDRDIRSIAGVVETGLFIDLAHAVVIGYDDGKSELREK